MTSLIITVKPPVAVIFDLLLKEIIPSNVALLLVNVTVELSLKIILQ